MLVLHAFDQDWEFDQLLYFHKFGIQFLLTSAPDFHSTSAG